VSIADGTVRKITDDASGANQVYVETVPGLDNVTRASCGVSPLNEFACGRPLGIHFDSNDALYVADAYKGLLKYERTASGEAGPRQELLSSIDGVPMRFTNSLLVDESEGIVYLTDTSQEFFRLQFVTAVIANQPDGRLIKFNEATGETQVLLDDLTFANGIQFWERGANKAILIIETGASTIRRYYTHGPKAGTDDLFVKNLAGYPDNLTVHPDGSYLVGLFSEEAHFLSAIHAFPQLQFLARLNNPLDVIGQFRTMGLIKKIDQRGRIEETWVDPTGALASFVSEAHIYDGKLFLGSVVLPFFTTLDPATDLVDMTREQYCPINSP
jgi:sugar lactone lactonase YvrE